MSGKGGNQDGHQVRHRTHSAKMAAGTDVARAAPQLHRAGWSRLGRWSLLLVVLMLTVTGVLLYALNPADPAAADWSDAARHWQRTASVLHGAFAWMFCIALGRWVWPHVALVWVRAPRRWQWGLGLVTAGIGAIAALSGLGLLYGAANWRESLSSAHWAVGVTWPLLCLVHGWRPLMRAWRGVIRA